MNPEHLSACSRIQIIFIYIYTHHVNTFKCHQLVGGFNPSEKYEFVGIITFPTYGNSHSKFHGSKPVTTKQLTWIIRGFQSSSPPPHDVPTMPAARSPELVPGRGAWRSLRWSPGPGDGSGVRSGTRRDPKWGSGSKWGTEGIYGISMVYLWYIYGVYYSLLDGMCIYIYIFMMCI